MTETAYSVATAARALQADRLLAYALLRSGDGWRPAEPAELPGRFLGAAVDSRDVRPGELFIALSGMRTDGRLYVSQALNVAACALAGLPSDQTQAAAPGRSDRPIVPLDDPLCRVSAPDRRVVLVCGDPRRALGLLAGHWCAAQSTLMVAITGSNGKTTTKDFLAALLGGAGPTLATRGNLNNELGLPLTLLRLRPEHRFAAVEMGASAAGEITTLAALVRPRVGVITNAAEAHLAAFGSIDGVVAGKGELLDVLPPDGVAILNHDSPGYERWRRRARCRVITFGRTGGDHRWHWWPHQTGGKLELDGERWAVPLPGLHNGGNLTAAILAARAAGVTTEQMRVGLAGFRPSPHRSRLLTVGDRLLLDDSYNANPASVRSATAALLALAGGQAVALLGTMAELGPRSSEIHRQTGRELCADGLDVLVAVGEAAQPLAAGFIAAGGRAFLCASAAEAADWAERHTNPGDRMLVKGSRSAAMDEVVTLLEQRFRNTDTSE